MSRPKLLLAVSILALAAAVLARPAAAQSTTTTNDTFTISVLVGAGGSVDESDAGYDNLSFQIGGSVVIEQNVEVGLRIGRLGFGSDEVLGDLFDPDLTYVTLAGEYLFGEPTYQSGVFIGLGAYLFDGSELFTGESVSTTRLGLTVGATGEFDVSERVGILAELAAHVVPSAPADFFATGMVGVALYFN